MKKHKCQQEFLIQNNYEIRPYIKFLPYFHYKKLINKVAIPMGRCIVCQKPKNAIEHE